jgi:hypothetical protein
MLMTTNRSGHKKKGACPWEDSMSRTVLILAGLLAMTACKSVPLPLPKTMGDPVAAPNYGYSPIDPLPVQINSSDVSRVSNADILKALPDETMRIAVGTFDASGGITFGPATLSGAQRDYLVVLDYIKFDTKSRSANVQGTGSARRASLDTTDSANLAVPVYVGVGLRLTASIRVHEAGIDLGNLLALGAAAQAQKVSGTLVVQTLGISGESVSTMIPMPSEISTSSIQAAILALGAIKAKIYEQDTLVAPRVVGIYNNLGGGQATIDSFITDLLNNPRDLDVRIPEKTAALTD